MEDLFQTDANQAMLAAEPTIESRIIPDCG
jgi:hypothetical protein